MKFAVLSLATDALSEMRELTFANKRAYCEKHGYQWIGANKAMDSSRPPAWSKIRMLQEACIHLPGWWAFWTDADSLIVRPDWKIESIADDNADLIISQDRNGINTGSFLIRLGNQTWQFLTEAYEQTQYLNHRWWDQAAIRHVIDSGYPFRVKLADKTLINAYPDDFKEGHSAIIHVPNNPKMWPNRMDELRKRLPQSV